MVGLLFPGANVANQPKIVWGLVFAFAYGAATGLIIGYVVALCDHG